MGNSKQDFDRVKTKARRNALKKKKPLSAPTQPEKFQAQGQDDKEVRLTRAILIQGISNVSCDKRESVEVDKQFPRVTHLHLQMKGIDVLGGFHHFRNLTVLYLYDNRIRKIIGLEQVRHLEALYLQRNRLTEIGGLDGCRRLRKLYLGQNEILLVEGLNMLSHLEVLHIEEQKLLPGEQLVFDPLTLDTLSKRLQVLNAGGNGITSLENLAGLPELHTLLLQENEIYDLEKTSLVLTTLPSLRIIDLRQNPIAKSPKYQEKVIGHCPTIELLDGKTYSATSRQFITKFLEMKASHLRRSLAAMDAASGGSQLSPSGGPTETSATLTSQAKPFDRHYDESLHYLYPPPGRRAADINRFNEMKRGLARMRIRKYVHRNLPEDMVQAGQEELPNPRLLKPQEIIIPRYDIASKVFSEKSKQSVPGSNKSGHKPKIYRGLASRGYSSVTKLPVKPSGATAVQPHRSTSSSSLEWMMPITRSISKLQGAGSEVGDVEPDNVKEHDSGSTGLSWTKPPEPKIFKLPPWPHILRNCGTTQKVNFI